MARLGLSEPGVCMYGVITEDSMARWAALAGTIDDQLQNLTKLLSFWDCGLFGTCCQPNAIDQSIGLASLAGSIGLEPTWGSRATRASGLYSHRVAESWHPHCGRIEQQRHGHSLDDNRNLEQWPAAIGHRRSGQVDFSGLSHRGLSRRHPVA